MNRYKIKREDFPKAIKYLAGKAFKSKTPSWVVKNEKFLQVVDGKVRYNNLPIIPSEDVADYLRKQVFGKDSKTPLSRDGMHHIVKQQVAGISRRAIMDFLRGQSVVQKGKGAVPKQKLAGKKLKDYHISFDLVFLKKRDVEKANKLFRDSNKLDGDPNDEDKSSKGLTYIVSVVESVSGLTKLAHVSRKLPKVVSPIVLKLMREIAKDLKTPLKQISCSSDKGAEFSQKLLEPHVKSYKRVPTAPTCEKKNSDIQRTFFQMVRARRGKTVKKLLDTTQDILNNNINRITKKTANELVQKQEKKKDIKNYNKSRAQGTDGKILEKGDYVRIRLQSMQKNKKLDYKSYKNQLWSKRVYRVSAVSQKVPRKYRVNRKWYLTSMLMKTRPADEKSEAIIQKRDTKAEKAYDAAVQKNIDENKARLAADIAKAKKKDAEALRAPKLRKRKKPRSKRLAKFLAESAKDDAPMPAMRRGRRRARERMIRAQEKDRELEKLIGR